MKFLILVLTILLALSTLSAPIARAESNSPPSILLMDSMEYAYVHNKAGKQMYVHKIGQILRSMNLKSKQYEMSSIRDSQLVHLIQDNQAWSDVVHQVKTLCQNKAFRQRCNSLAQIRLNTFKYIKNHPE